MIPPGTRNSRQSPSSSPPSGESAPSPLQVSSGCALAPRGLVPTWPVFVLVRPHVAQNVVQTRKSFTRHPSALLTPTVVRPPILSSTLHPRALSSAASHPPPPPRSLAQPVIASTYISSSRAPVPSLRTPVAPSSSPQSPYHFFSSRNTSITMQSQNLSPGLQALCEPLVHVSDNSCDRLFCWEFRTRPEDDLPTSRSLTHEREKRFVSRFPRGVQRIVAIFSQHPDVIWWERRLGSP
ncbi:hypothetical protein F5148DRAFT_252158 [Russula earlei]|uniref:Uncharacterized protein n=1 Tax=Russula earlei TaxID=71964 RepID=A0ACC0U386_9AGAM|nr:hypothetical protein F5148DRAFT_252158 [Russula earlei]